MDVCSASTACGCGHVGSHSRSGSLRAAHAGEKPLQCGVVHLADKAREVRRTGSRLLLVASCMMSRIRDLVSRVSWVRCVRCVRCVMWRLCWCAICRLLIRSVLLAVSCSCTRCLGSQNHLRGSAWIQVHVLVKANIVGAGGAVKHLYGNLAHILSAHVQLHNCMNALCSLALYHLVFGKSRVQEHDLGSQALFLERALNPAHEVPVDLLLQNNLNIRDISTIPSRQIELCAVP